MKKYCFFLLLGLVCSTTFFLASSMAAELENRSIVRQPGEASVSEIIDKTLGDHTAYKSLIERLKEAVATDNKQAVAELMSYPLEVDLDGNSATIDGETMFQAYYDLIMVPEIVSAIQNTSYADVMVDYQGVMLGEGQVWINGICKDDTCTDVDVLVSTLQKGPD